ncbi:MAG: VCBS repeat-containing protein, partial [Actinobacteria bacterium]|nr:VCBS repeat-containing protein [Actinomycetota bacterium]NIS32053.1 VCBS repeat-containing protein [Actinomycetota bacterium]NIU19712.1 VCBS repeat-containing protein [Actinomycetota bacterium]NIU67125.1 VCBS repeat-containing protein [Actinomycetota bacterium]NIV87669.1 hypothetical protein [Actinomycetota bacterium]
PTDPLKAVPGVCGCWHPESSADVDTDGTPDCAGLFGAFDSYGAGAAPYSVTLADLDGNGTLELITTTFGTPEVFVRRGFADGTFAGTPLRLGSGVGALDVTTADLNGDGALDLLTANPASPGYVGVWLGNGDRTFGARTDVVMGQQPAYVIAPDLDGDGDLDLVTANRNS